MIEDRFTDHWSTRNFAHDVISVLDAAGIRRAHIYGHSMGGPTRSGSEQNMRSASCHSFSKRQRSATRRAFPGRITRHERSRPDPVEPAVLFYPRRGCVTTGKHTGLSTGSSPHTVCFPGEITDRIPADELCPLARTRER